MIDFKDKTDKEIDELYEAFNSEEKRDAVKKSVMENIDDNLDAIREEYERRHKKEDVDIKKGDCFVRAYNKLHMTRMDKYPYHALSFYVVTDSRDNGDVIMDIYTYHFDKFDRRSSSRYGVMMKFPMKADLRITNQNKWVAVSQLFREGRINDIFTEMHDTFCDSVVNNNSEEPKEGLMIHPIGTIFKTSRWDGKEFVMSFDTVLKYNGTTDEYTCRNYTFKWTKQSHFTSSNSSVIKKRSDLRGETCTKEHKNEIIGYFHNDRINDILKMTGYEYDATNGEWKSEDKGYNEISIGKINYADYFKWGRNDFPFFKPFKTLFDSPFIK